MVILRSIRNYLSLASFADVSSALAAFYRSVQDALNELSDVSSLKPSTFLDVGNAAAYGDRLLVRAGAVALPSALIDRKTIEITNIGSGSIPVVQRAGETINGGASYSLATLTTVRLTSDGRGGWWG